jgi:hypothetical protein
MDAHSGDATAHPLLLMTRVAVVEADNASGKLKMAAMEAESASGKADTAAVKAECAAAKEKIASLEADSSNLQRYASIMHASGEEAAAGRMK